MAKPADPLRAEPILTVEDVSLTFRAGKRIIKALDGISFQQLPGTIHGLIGPDGAGKTTLMRLIAGLLLPDSGNLNVLGIDVIRDPLAVQASIGYMPQHFGLYEDLTVRENLNLYADLQGLSPEERPARYEELMRMTGLEPFTGRLAGKLSGGMKQKLGLACTLVYPPRFLLLDEPTIGVDPVSRRELWAIIQQLVNQEGMTVLLSTAYLDEAERCQDVILIHEGKLLGKGSPSSFSRQMTGRSFQVTASGTRKRNLQERLSRAPGILDAIILGDGVRVVTVEAKPPAPSAILPGLADVEITSVPPRFEDSFIAMLKKEPVILPVAPARDRVSAPVQEIGKAITVRNLTRRFGDFYAVKDISFEVDRGEVFGLLGANGAGKSTTFRMLCGLLPPSGGSLEVAGKNLRRSAAKARARIGYMAQHFSLYVGLSVLENLSFFSSAYGLRGQARRDRVKSVMEEFELTPVADTTSGELPLGYKQRLSLAAALMHSPKILFLDEPTSGVDPLARREFWHRINGLAEQGVTILVTTHFMEEAAYCDRLVIMSRGEILSEGTPEEMKDSIRSPENPDPTMEEVFIKLIEDREGNDRRRAG